MRVRQPCPDCRGAAEDSIVGVARNRGPGAGRRRDPDAVRPPGSADSPRTPRTGARTQATKRDRRRKDQPERVGPDAARLRLRRRRHQDHPLRVAAALTTRRTTPQPPDRPPGGREARRRPPIQWNRPHGHRGERSSVRPSASPASLAERMPTVITNGTTREVSDHAPELRAPTRPQHRVPVRVRAVGNDGSERNHARDRRGSGAAVGTRGCRRRRWGGSGGSGDPGIDVA